MTGFMRNTQKNIDFNFCIEKVLAKREGNMKIIIVGGGKVGHQIGKN